MYRANRQRTIQGKRPVKEKEHAKENESLFVWPAGNRVVADGLWRKRSGADFARTDAAAAKPSVHPNAGGSSARDGDAAPDADVYKRQL